jgi:hypothetical protein
LHEEGSLTTQEIKTALGQTQRDWVDRATTLGRETGLFTSHVGARNLRTFSVVTTPPPQHPPVYPARAILAPGVSAMNAAHLDTANRQVSVPKNGKVCVPETGKLTVKVGTTLISRGRDTTHESKEQSLTEIGVEGNTGTSTEVVASAAQRVAPRRKYAKPSPVPSEPSPEVVQEVYALAHMWAAACRTAFNVLRWNSALRAEAWRSPDPKQQRRWRAFYRLWAMLREHQIDPAEFCVAVTHRRSQWSRRTVPNPASMSGECGRQIYWWWKERMTQVEAEKWVGTADLVRKEAQASLRSRTQSLALSLRHAWAECKHVGAREAMSFLWQPEVIWLLRQQEPAARPIIAELLAQPNSEYAPKMRAALRKLETDLRTQAWLIKLWSRVIGPRRTLHEYAVPDDVLARQIAAREQRHAAIASRVAERRAQAESEMKDSIRWTMWSARRRQAVRRVSP